MSQASVRDLFDQAFELPREQWQEFLSRATDDAGIRAQVLRLLAAAGEKTDFLERPLMPAARSSVGAGRRLGPYVIDAEIGRGGMGVVYRATRADDAFHKTVAIKAVPFGMPEDAFRRERQILASLEHPNIARLLDGGATEDGVLYLVMELIAGERLDHYAQQHDLSTKDQLRLLLPVFDAVSYAHRNLVVHRDLKPANILVTADGTPKLLDFGVAKVFEPDAEPSTRQDTRMLAMTIDYASPEQIRGEPVTTVSDVYSLGVIAYELLTRGRRPYAGAAGTETATAQSRMRAILEEDPLPPRVGAELDNILLKALAKEPERRYSSVEQFRADVEAYLEGRPVIAQAGGYRYRAWKLLRRHWLPVSAAAAVLLSSTIGAIAFLQQARVAEERRRVAESATQRAESLLREKEGLLREQVRLSEQAQREAKVAQEQSARSERLANSLLFQVHDSLDNVAGTANTRERIVKQTLPELETLHREAPNDDKVRRSLAAAYERAGELAGGARGEGTQGSAAGLEYFLKALALLRQDQLVDPMRMAILEHKTGALLYASNRAAEGEALVQHALATLRGMKTRPANHSTLEMETSYHLCQIRVTMGHNAAASACADSVALLERAAASDASTVEDRQQRAAGYQRLAILAHSRGEVPHAVQLLRAAILEWTRLMKDFPDKADYKRSLSLTLGHYARWRELIGDADAVAAYGEALKLCRTVRQADPKLNAVGLLHGWTAMRYAAALHARKRDTEARASVKESLEIHEELLRAPKPGFTEFNEYAMQLMLCPFPDLCDARKALQHAETAVKMTNASNPFALDTLANALFRNGDAVKAAEMARKALANGQWLPKAARDEVEANLKRFEAKR